MIALAEWIVATAIVLFTGYAILLWFIKQTAVFFAPLDRWIVNRRAERRKARKLLKE